MGEQRHSAASASSAGTAAAYPGGWLGYERLNSATGRSASQQTVMQLSVTVPEDRAIRVLWQGLVSATSPMSRARVRITEEDALLQVRERTCPQAGVGEEVTALVHLTPTAGEHVYVVTVEGASGEGEVAVIADPACPAEMIVEDVGPAPAG